MTCDSHHEACACREAALATELDSLRQQISAMRGALARMSDHVLQLVREKYNENSPTSQPKD